MADEQSLLDALDTKAQGAIATAGIFVAAILAFINAIAKTKLRHAHE